MSESPNVRAATGTRPATTWRRWIPPLLAALLVAVLAAALLRGGGGDPGGPLVGKPAPDFTLTTLDGGSVKLSALRGRPVLLNFWASWCIPCRDEAPLLADLARGQGANGLAVVGVVYQDKPGDAKRFRDQYGLTFPSLLDPKLNTAIDYGVGAVPESFFIDKNGVVQKHLRQELTRETLASELGSIGVKE